MALAGSTVLIGGAAHANDADTSVSAATAAAHPHSTGGGDDHRHDGQTGEEIVVTGERYRINTLNSRLPDVRDAPQSISIIPREVIEQQSGFRSRGCSGFGSRIEQS